MLYDGAIQFVFDLPDSPGALLQVKGIGTKLLEKYGRQLLEIIVDYREKHQIAGRPLPTF